MDRRDFIKTAAASAAALHTLNAQATQSGVTTSRLGSVTAAHAPVDGHTKLATFARNGETWTVYEDLRVRDGVITFVSSAGRARILRKTAEATFADDGPQYLGLSIKDIGMADRDLLADKLLANGDPAEDDVRKAAPPMNSAHREGRNANARPSWNTFVGTRECSDTMPIFPSGNTRTYHPIQYFKELTQQRADKRFEGLIGGWMPAVRKVLPGDNGSSYEIVVFGDVLAKDRFIVQTWHRTSHIEDGKVTKVEFGHSYPAYTRRRQEPKAAEFYRAMLEFAEYWERQTHDLASMTLPDTSWTDMVRYAFVKEQMVRPGGVYPKYGAVDRDYYGSEYDGFQDTFTMALYANMECGRFQLAHDIFDNYFTDFTDDKGMINMRGPETGQFGLTLFLIARYFRLTGDKTLLIKHREKIEATATLLAELQDEALKLPASDRGYGMIHGWCESDSCLMADPSIWDKPYFSNSAFAVRGWRDIALVWRTLKFPGGEPLAAEWTRRSEQLQSTLTKSIDANTRHDMTPAYIGPLPGTKLTFRESLAQEHPSEQGWSHRCYAELLEPDVLPAAQANTVIDCMRAYGATTVGVVANVGRANPYGRAILGFISYGYAAALLRLNRVEEYILFLYAHRYHDHSRGSWTAGEVSGISGGGAIFCIPAQQTIPLLVRWMLVFEDSDDDHLHFGRALPREWVATGKPIEITGAPTRWGRVDYRLESRGPNTLVATVTLPAATATKGRLPHEVHVSFRAPTGRTLGQATSNGKPVQFGGPHHDAVIIIPGEQRRFEVVAQLV
ncbi:MAG TPA: Tat pathway signal protein [Acidobacteriaceae bacterium]